MEQSKYEKDLIQILYNGDFYLEWTTACEVIGLPRTSLIRSIEKHGLLQESDVFEYKNRKLVKKEWVFNFWKELSKKRG